MKERAVQRIFNVKPYQPGRPIDEVKRELGLTHVIKLASNENPDGPSPKVLEAVMEAVRGANRYPDGGCYDLREAVARHLGIKPDQLLFGNGSDEIIILAIRAFVEPGDEVVVSHPSFAVYAIGSKLAGAQLKVIPMADFRHDLDAMAAAVTPRTKIIFIDNPGNPSGRYVTGSQVKALLDRVPRDVVVFLDEAYYEYACEEPDYPRSIGWLEQYPNLVVARTFSKAYGLAGLRVGYAAAGAEMIDILNRVREPFNVNSAAQAGAIAALEDQDYYRRSLKVLDGERVLLIEEAQRLGLAVVPGVTNFILIDVKAESRWFSDALLAKGVIVRDMAPWGLNTFIRVTIGRPEENREFLKALKDVITQGRRS